MGSRSASTLLRLPVQLHGIRLGRTVDVLLDAGSWRALGVVVHCGDDSDRFLPFAALELDPDEIVVDSALVLLEDVGFYRSRARSLRSLLGRPVVRGQRELGELRDVCLTDLGIVTALVVEQDGRARRVRPARATVATESVSAA